MDFDIKDVENVLKLDVEDNDILVITLPINQLPRSIYEQFAKYVANGFKEVLQDKKVKIVTVPAGTVVELIKSSMLDDK